MIVDSVPYDKYLILTLVDYLSALNLELLCTPSWQRMFKSCFLYLGHLFVICKYLIDVHVALALVCLIRYTAIRPFFSSLLYQQAYQRNRAFSNRELLICFPLSPYKVEPIKCAYFFDFLYLLPGRSKTYFSF